VRTWKLEDAKNRFSELVRRALADGPQRVTRGGRDAVIVVAEREYERLTMPPANIIDFLRQSPLAAALRDGELDLSRTAELGRDLPL
jgi:prevent-host-death family protein